MCWLWQYRGHTATWNGSRGAVSRFPSSERFWWRDSPRFLLFSLVIVCIFVWRARRIGSCAMALACAILALSSFFSLSRDQRVGHFFGLSFLWLNRLASRAAELWASPERRWGSRDSARVKSICMRAMRQLQPCMKLQNWQRWYCKTSERCNTGVVCAFMIQLKAKRSSLTLGHESRVVHFNRVAVQKEFYLILEKWTGNSQGPKYATPVVFVHSWPR